MMQGQKLGPGVMPMQQHPQQIIPPGGIPMQQAMVQMQQPIPPPMPMQPQQQAQTAEQKKDNISKVKMLVGPLKESLANVMRTAAQNSVYNQSIDSQLKGSDTTPNRFDKSLEEFYSICDQMELHLNTAIKCLSQSQSSQRYLNMPVAVSRPEVIIPPNQDVLNYNQFLSTVRVQVSYAKDIHDALVEAARLITAGE